MTEYRVTSVSLTMTLADSTTLNIGDSDIILGSLSVSEASSGSTEFSIGTAISKRLSFQLKNFNDEYSAYDFNDAQIVATIIADADSTVDEANGIVSGFGGTMGSDSVVTLTGASMDDNGIVTLSGSTTTDNYTLGVFYVVEKPNYNGGTITFNALDGLYKTDRDYTTALTFPATLLQIYNELCTNCGIVPAQATIPNANYSVPVKPNLDATTAADMLCYIAQISGTFAQMNSQGKLELKRYGGTSHSLSETFSMEVDTDDVVITGVKVTECFDETDTLKRQTVLNGTAAYALTIAENPLIGSGKAQAVADFLTSVYVGMQFRPLRITVPTNPEVHVGDSIVFTDYKGNTYSTYATEVDFSTNAPTTIAMNAASPERNSAVRYSAEAKALAESKRLVENEKTARELAIDQIAQQIAGAGGMYETTVAQTGGGNIYYLHNKPTLAESTTILRIDDTGIYISNDGGQTYPIGLDYSGTEILDKIYAIGIDADYITTGLIQSRVSGFSLNMDTGVANLSNVNITGGTINVEQTSGGPHYHSEFMNVKYYDHSTTSTENYYLNEFSINSSGYYNTYYTARLPVGSERPATKDDYSGYTRGTFGSSGVYFSVKDGEANAAYRPYEFRLTNQLYDKTTLTAGYNATSGAVELNIYPYSSSGSVTGQLVVSGGRMGISAGKVTALTTAPMGGLFMDGVAFTNPGTKNDQGWVRVLGTGESDTVMEIATGDDANGSEQIVFRRYNSSNAVERQFNIFNANGNSSGFIFDGFSFSGGGSYTVDANGNFTHKRNTTTDYWHLNANNGTANYAVFWETGTTLMGQTKYFGHTITGSDGTTNVWTRLGTLTSAGDASSAIITLYTGDGYNGSGRQNTIIRINIKDGWQSTQSASNAFGVSVTYEDSPNMNNNNIWSSAVSVRATAHNVCDVWVKLPWGYYNGEYTVEGRYSNWVHSGTRQTATPASGVYQDIKYHLTYGISTNTSGYIRFAQGEHYMQIAWKQVTVSTAWTSAWNSLWESSLIDVGGWAANFSARPASAASAFGNGNTRGAMFESNTGASATSAGKYYLVNTGKITDAASMVVTVIAVGPWG